MLCIIANLCKPLVTPNLSLNLKFRLSVRIFCAMTLIPLGSVKGYMLQRGRDAEASTALGRKLSYSRFDPYLVRQARSSHGAN
jgi:hypothetical protein